MKRMRNTCESVHNHIYTCIRVRTDNQQDFTQQRNIIKLLWGPD